MPSTSSLERSVIANSPEFARVRSSRVTSCAENSFCAMVKACTVTATAAANGSVLFIYFDSIRFFLLCQRDFSSFIIFAKLRKLFRGILPTTVEIMKEAMEFFT